MIPRLLPPLSTLLLTIVPLAAQEVPKPQAEHKKLAQSVGTWDALIESFGMDGKQLTSKGVLEEKSGPGGFWLVEDFTGDCMGTQCTGHGTLGYDSIKKVWVQSWVFSMSPSLMVWTGTFDAAGKVLTMTGEAPNTDGTLTKMRKVMTWASADSMKIEVFLIMSEAKEMKTMTLTCTRRAGEDTEKPGARK